MFEMPQITSVFCALRIDGVIRHFQPIAISPTV